MTLTQIKKEATCLSEHERKELVTYLIHVEQTQDGDFLNRITRKIDEKERYQKWDDIKEKFN